MSESLPRSVRSYASILEREPELLRDAEALPDLDAAPDTGRILVRDFEGFLRRFVVLPAHSALPLAAWALGTYCFDCFEAFAYLAVTSPTPRCGKSRLLRILSRIVSNPESTSNISEPALFRIIASVKPTLLLDEAETLRGRGERAEYLRNVLNAGNLSDSTVTRCDRNSHKVERFDVYCPKAVACIGGVPATIADRSIIVGMQRRRDSEPVARYLTRKVRPEGDALRARAAEWVRTYKPEIVSVYEGLDLDFLEDREAEVWEPLFALLSVADPARLGELRGCAESLSRAKAASAEDDSVALQLLVDIRAVWPESEPKIFTADLLRRLKAIEDGPWASDEKFDGRKLSRFLRPFGVAPGSVQIGAENLKGYHREAAKVAFARYLGSQPSEPSEPA